jgi:hypothetical protein
LQVAKLAARQAASKDSILVFSNNDFEEFAAAKGRDYHLMFFLNAHYMAKNTDMNLPKLRQEYALAAQVCGPVCWDASFGHPATQCVAGCAVSQGSSSCKATANSSCKLGSKQQSQLCCYDLRRRS